MGYQVGSDKKTASMAADLVAKIDALIEAGDFAEAERLIDAGVSTPNRPFRAEFLSQCAY